MGEWVTMTMVVRRGGAFQQIHHRLAIAVSRLPWFVRQDQLRVRHQSAGDGDTLLLAARQLLRPWRARCATPTRSSASATRLRRPPRSLR